MEGRQARDLAGWGANLGVHPDAPVARNLFATLHALWLGASRAGDRVARLKPDLEKGLVSPRWIWWGISWPVSRSRS